MEPAHTLADVYKTINPDESIPPDDPRYVDISEARGSEDLVSLIKRRIITCVTGQYHQRLITGHRGSGKSTELRRLEAMLKRDGFLVSYLDVAITLDLADVEYLDVLVAAAFQIFITAHKNGLKVQDKLLSDVEDWFSDIVDYRGEEDIAELKTSVTAEVGIEVPLLARLLSSVTGQIRSGSTARRDIRLELEKRLEDLQNRIKLLVNDVSARGRQKGFKGLVLIIDSLEKMPLKFLDNQGNTNQSSLFVEHAEQLKFIPCHLIITVPVSLLNNRNLGIAFTDIDLIPMVKTVTADQYPWKTGIELMLEIVTRRADIESVFQDKQVVESLIQASGGVVRDLMRLILFASDYTNLDSKIKKEAADKAISKLIREYDRLIHEEDLETLKLVSQNPHIPSSTKLSRLMYNRLILPYINDKNWVGIHPAVQNSPTYRSSLGI